MRRAGGTAIAKVSATGAVLVALLAGCVTQAANAPSPTDHRGLTRRRPEWRDGDRLQADPVRSR